MTDFEWTVSLNRFALRIIGLWPQDFRHLRQISGLKLRRLCNLVALLFTLTIPILISLIKVWGDLILMIDNMQYSLPMLMTVSKVCIIWHKQEVLELLINMVENDWTKVKMKEERDVMLKQARITRVVALCGLSMIFLCTIATCGFPYLQIMIRYLTNHTDSEKFLPLQIYYPHDVTKSPQYELTLLAQTFGLLAGAFSYTGIDNLMCLLILHICGQLENLHSRLIYMEKYSDFEAVLKYIVEDHVRLIRFIEIVDNTFHLLLLGVILYFTVLFCLQGFLIVNIFYDNSQLSVTQFAWFILAIITNMVHMSLYCAVGEILVTQSEKVHHAVYKCVWYTLEPKAARNLIIIMLRANKPLYVTAGKMFPMTMATFSSLLKTSAGYISVLLASQH